MLANILVEKGMRPRTRWWRKDGRLVSGIALTALPLPMLVLPGDLVSTAQALWLSSALYAALPIAGPQSSTALKACKILAASILCSLALVNTGA